MCKVTSWCQVEPQIEQNLGGGAKRNVCLVERGTRGGGRGGVYGVESTIYASLWLCLWERRREDRMTGGSAVVCGRGVWIVKMRKAGVNSEAAANACRACTHPARHGVWPGRCQVGGWR